LDDHARSADEISKPDPALSDHASSQLGEQQMVPSCGSPEIEYKQHAGALLEIRILSKGSARKAANQARSNES
jgi:hypothetical protein